jgi:hypothetical protein
MLQVVNGALILLGVIWVISGFRQNRSDRRAQRWQEQNPGTLPDPPAELEG